MCVCVCVCVCPEKIYSVRQITLFFLSQIEMNRFFIHLTYKKEAVVEHSIYHFKHNLMEVKRI